MVWALFESADGVEAQPPIADAAVIKNVPPRIQAAFLFNAIGIPNLGIRIHTTTLYAIEPLEAKPEPARAISTTSYIRGPNFAIAPAVPTRSRLGTAIQDAITRAQNVWSAGADLTCDSARDLVAKVIWGVAIMLGDTIPRFLFTNA